MKDFLARQRSDIRTEIEAADAWIGAHDLASQNLGKLMNSLALLDVRVEYVHCMAFWQNETMERPNWEFVADRKSEVVFAQDR